MVVMRIKTVVIIIVVIFIYCHYWPGILGRDGK